MRQPFSLKEASLADPHCISLEVQVILQYIVMRLLLLLFVVVVLTFP